MLRPVLKKNKAKSKKLMVSQAKQKKPKSGGRRVTKRKSGAKLRERKSKMDFKELNLANIIQQLISSWLSGTPDALNLLSWIFSMKVVEMARACADTAVNDNKKSINVAAAITSLGFVIRDRDTLRCCQQAGRHALNKYNECHGRRK
eukprot:TRINITY_DN18609_c0_g1_i1.p1 TRINITY_DN18609_c0_g1~~TRINITY_DN18609_c0_g1_i1.p1  ORF type:complete len:147 (+),score=14.50 TRINITY_DN18609_c0_g1_i1:64-504(+)